MTKLSTEITKLINAANALGAPLFGLDTLLTAANDLEGLRANIVERVDAHESTDDSFRVFFFRPTEAVDVQLNTISKASQAAWALIAQPYLPDSLASSVRGNLEEGTNKEITEALRAGINVAESRIGQPG